MTKKIKNGNYEFRPFMPGDEDNILNLWKIAFKDRMPLKRLQWKFIDNPYYQAMMLCVAENNDIVTFYGGIPYLFQCQDKLEHVVQLMDIMSHPDHREGKVFLKTASQFIARYCMPGQLLCMYGFPGAIHFAIGKKILNYQKISPASYLVASIPDMIFHQSLYRTVRMEKVHEQELDSPAWQKLWQHFSQIYPFSLVRNASFLKWRFFNHPEKTYKVYKFCKYHSEDILGYAVLSYDAEKAVLVDFLISNSFDLFQEALNCLMIYLVNKQIITLATWFPGNHFLNDWAKASGWEQRDEPIGIVPTVALFEHSPSLEWIDSNIYYTMADADLF